jgi:hypothetical protein
MSPRHLVTVIAGLVLIASGSVAAAASLRPFDAGSIEAIRKSNQGRPFVLAFWSIHCAPCIEDMDGWRALQSRHPGVSLILVTTDPPAEHDKVRRVLARYRMGGVQSWAFADEFSERVRFAVDPRWRGELPRTYFYDRTGKAATRTGRVDTARAEEWLKQQESK